MTRSGYFVSWKQKELWKNKRLHISSLGRKMSAKWRGSYRRDGRQGQPASLQIPAHTIKPHICYLERESYLHVYLRRKRNCCWYMRTQAKKRGGGKQVLFFSRHLIIDHNNTWGEVVCCTTLAEMFSCSSFKNRKMLQPKCAWIHTAPECTCTGQRATLWELLLAFALLRHDFSVLAALHNPS